MRTCYSRSLASIRGSGSRSEYRKEQIYRSSQIPSCSTTGLISLKLILLFLTVCFAVVADKFVFPRLTDATIYTAAIMILSVTFLGVALLVLGTFVRMGGL